MAVSDWLGGSLAISSAPEADLTEELARRCLAAYGPATATDFATWAGLPIPAARKAVEAVAALEFTVDGEPLHAIDDLPGTDNLRLVGEFDAYLLGYRDRQHAARRPGEADPSRWRHAPTRRRARRAGDRHR